MSSDIYRRVGRGGAGNFYSPQDVEDVKKKSEETKDLEAQRPTAADSASIHSTATTAATGPVYSKAGRGGAGNFYEPGAGAEAEHRRAEAEAERTRLAVASAAKMKTGLSGRGGVGNWTDTAAEVADQERKQKEDLEAKILQDVEAGLMMPPKTYHQHEREMEK